uniref:Leucine-rich repeat-containing N-terminal plant-type domain-containing protein n=1 Tax=Oryza sativa subsp. japonica TaxID=39947 RepID=Q2R2H6_ORYSJ|nr:hypothetical protein LOC_Os11g35790 [Oryza sativa Japonica Group]
MGSHWSSPPVTAARAAAAVAGGEARREEETCTGSLFLVADALHEHHHGRPNIAGATCVPHERDALLAFKEGVVGDPVGRLASWRTGEDCFRHWRGVRCSNLTGHVLKLHLRNTDGGEAAMSGKVSSSLLSLQHLRHHDLSMNNLQALPRFLRIAGEGPIPEFLLE